MSDATEQLAKQEQGVLEIIGIEPWALKSIPKEKVIPFLRDVAKFLARYHHPDLYIHDADKKKHGDYLSRVNSTVDALATDRFALEEALADFNTIPNQRISLELRLQKTAESKTAISNTSDTLRKDLDALKKEYRKMVRSNENIRKDLDHAVLMQGYAQDRFEVVGKQLEFARSDKGPHKTAQRRIDTLMEYLQRRREYELEALTKSNPIKDNMQGEVSLNLIHKDALYYPEYDAATKSSDTTQAFRRIFQERMSPRAQKLTLQENQTVTIGPAGEWQILGVIPYEHIKYTHKNAMTCFNFDQTKGKKKVNEFEADALPYVLPFIETADKGLTLIKKHYPFENVTPMIYRLVAISKLKIYYANNATPQVDPLQYNIHAQ